MTFAPLCKIMDLLKTPFNQNHSQFKELYKNNNKDYCIEASRSSWSLYFIVKAFIDIKGYSPTILVPFYFCNSSLDPIRKLNVNLKYYNIDDNLEPDYKKLASLVQEEKCDIFILVHYFGFLSNINDAKEFVQEFDLLFIEDCAHLIKPIGMVGRYSDFQIYSLYKHFAIPDGAFLIISSKHKEYNNNIESLISNEKQLPFLSLLKWIVKKIILNILDKCKLSGKINKLKFSNFDVLYYPSINYEYKCISSFSLKIVDKNLLNETIKNKNKNFNNLLNIKKELVFIKNEGIPYMLMLKFKNETLSKYMYNNLNNNGMPTTTWPDLIKSDEIPKDILTLRKSTVFLQLHMSGYQL